MARIARLFLHEITDFSVQKIVYSTERKKVTNSYNNTAIDTLLPLF